MNEVHTSTEFGVAGSWLAEYTLTALGAAVMTFDADGRAVHWDAAAAELLGVTEQQLAGQRLGDARLRLVRADGEPVTDSTDPVVSVLADGEPIVGETIGVRSPAGGTVWRSISLLPIYGVDRRPRAVLASVVGLDEAPAATSRRSGDDEWRRLAASLYGSSLTADLVIDPSGTIVQWNGRALDLTGRTDAELVGSGLADVCDIDVDWLWDEVRRRAGEHLDGSTFVLRPSGDELTVVGRFVLAAWPGFGDVIVARLLEPTAITDDAMDVPDAADSLVFLHAQIPLLMATARGVVIDANHLAADLLGQSRRQLIGRTVSQLVLGLGLDEMRSSAVESEVMGGTVDVGAYVVSPRSGDGVAPVNVSLTSIAASGCASNDLLIQVTRRVDTAWSTPHPEVEPYGDLR